MKNMVEVLSFQNHKLSNTIFIATNITAILFVVMSIVNVTIWFNGSLSLPSEMRFTFFVYGVLGFLVHIFLALVLLCFGQILRYLASIAETTARMIS